MDNKWSDNLLLIGGLIITAIAIIYLGPLLINTIGTLLAPYISPSLSFLLGVFCLLSPCGFALLPGYIAYRVIGHKGLQSATIFSLVASVGIILLFVVLGIMASLAGEVLLGYMPILNYAVASIIILLGMFILMNRLDPLSTRLSNLMPSFFINEKLHAYGFGIIYGIAASSCSAPIFFAVLLAAATLGFPEGLFIMLSYAVGLSATLVTISLLVAAAKDVTITRIKQTTPLLRRWAGGVLIIVGLYIFWLLL
jgi:cytochrome c biogenesis protein CcdA